MNRTFPCDTIFQCTRCNQVFENNFELIRHENRKVLCDTIFQCSDCEQIFTTNSSLARHKNRKGSCSSKITMVQVQVQIKQLRLEERKLEEQRLDRIKNFELQEQKLKQRQQKLDQQERKFKHEVEMFEYKKQAKPKEKAIVFTGDKITKDYKRYIYTNFKDNDDMSTMRQTMETQYQYIADPLSNRTREVMLSHFDIQNNDRLPITKILLFYYKNSKSQSLFYYKDLDGFFGIYLNQNKELEIKEVMFDEEVLPIIQEYIIKLAECLIDNLEQFSPKTYKLTSFCERVKQNSYNYLRKYAGIAFWKDK
jgi:uncharacterized C2H2 Zn-finger protein